MIRRLLVRLRILKPGEDAEAEVVDTRRPMGAEYPAKVDSGHEHRRRDRLERYLIVALLLSLGSNCVQAGLSHVLFAQQRYDIVMVQTQPETKQVVTLMPVRWGVPGAKFAAEGWLRSYVEYRHALVPDRLEMGRRLEWIRNRSVEQVWEDFRSYNAKIVAEALAAQRTRGIEIKNVSELADGYYQIDFRVSESERGRPCERAGCAADYRALARIGFLPRTLNRDELKVADDADASMKLGFTVYSYGVAPLTATQ